MDLGCRLRITLAAVIAVAGAGSIALASAVNAGSPSLLPDLVTLDPLGSPTMQLNVNKKHAMLRLSNRIGNHGDGPLELIAGDVSDPCTDAGQYLGDDHEADQVVYEDTNGNNHYDGGDTGTAQAVGCFEYHPDHGHWHFQDFSQYRLADLDTGEPVAGPSRKIGFCMLDGDREVPEVPGAQGAGVYHGGCGFGDPDNGPEAMGISVGWADTYTYGLPGQRLNITGVSRGVYCLVSTANPSHAPDPDPSQLIESDEANNALRRPIKLNPEKEKAKEAEGTCAEARKR
jgi:hypothetical protein